MLITWVGHACFAVEKNGYRLVIDPYTAGSVPGLDPVHMEADQVLCSHEHGDHNGRGEVTLRENHISENPFSVEILQTYHDEVCGAKRGDNQIFLISDGVHRIAHLGDLGCDLTGRQMEQLTGLDAVFVPVGGYYTIDGSQAAALMKQLQPRLIIPMHFRDDQADFGFDVIETVEKFTEHMENAATTAASEIDMASESGSGVIVLQPLRKKKG